MTIICVYNDQKQLNDMLLRSLENVRGGGQIDTLIVDNTGHRYHSCAQAFNSELRAHWDELGDILVFLHQDIAFDDDAWMKRIEAELAADPNQVLGFAGMPKAGRTVSNLRYRQTGEYITATQVAEKTEVESLDECCFAMTRELYGKIGFDEKTCDHWHLYAVDFCYEARRRQGAKSFVLPETLYHKENDSAGLSVDRHFLSAIWKMTRKYRRFTPTIYTPCYITSTHWLQALLRIARTMVKNAVGRR